MDIKCIIYTYFYYNFDIVIFKIINVSLLRVIKFSSTLTGSVRIIYNVAKNKQLTEIKVEPEKKI